MREQVPAHSVENNPLYATHTIPYTQHYPNTFTNTVVQTTNSTHDRLWTRWNEVQSGKYDCTRLGMKEWNTQEEFTPHIDDVMTACAYKGKVDTRLVHAMTTGTFAQTTGRMAATDVSRQWTEKTIDDKERAVKTFTAFLQATGRLQKFLPEHEVPMTFPMEEERVLCEYAVMRCLAGNGTAAAATMVSHIRTWSRVMKDREFGKGGTNGVKSMTSQVLKGMSRYFDKEKLIEEKRQPLTWHLTKMIYEEGLRTAKENTGVAVAIAFVGLYRMGELTSTRNTPFNHTTDLAEAHIAFLPTFWTATTVTIYIGGSKADQEGIKDAMKPRVLPTGVNTPGRWLRDMIARRHNLPFGEEPTLTSCPLFQNERGGQITQRSVLRHMRSTLEKAGFTKHQQMSYGTHSARIGGATALFRKGATMEVIRELGGWASDAYKLYVRVQREDMLKFSSMMCSE